MNTPHHRTPRVVGKRPIAAPRPTGRPPEEQAVVSERVVQYAAAVKACQPIMYGPRVDPRSGRAVTYYAPDVPPVAEPTEVVPRGPRTPPFMGLITRHLAIARQLLDARNVAGAASALRKAWCCQAIHRRREIELLDARAGRLTEFEVDDWLSAEERLL